MDQFLQGSIALGAGEGAEVACGGTAGGVRVGQAFAQPRAVNPTPRSGCREPGRIPRTGVKGGPALAYPGCRAEGLEAASDCIEWTARGRAGDGSFRHRHRGIVTRHRTGQTR